MVYIRVILCCLLFKHVFAVLDYKCCNTVDTQEQNQNKNPKPRLKTGYYKNSD